MNAASRKRICVFLFCFALLSLGMMGCGGGSGSVVTSATPVPPGSVGPPATPPMVPNPTPTPPVPTPTTAAQFLYVANSDAMIIFGFKVDSNSGALTAVPGSPFPIGFSPVLMKATGKFLLVGNANPSLTNSFAEFSIDPTSGSLTLTSITSPFGGTFQTGPFFTRGAPLLMNSTVADSSGHVYISGSLPTSNVTIGNVLFSTNAIGGFTLDASGVLNPVPNSPFSFQISGVTASPGPLALNPGGRFLYSVLRACFIEPCVNIATPFNALAAIDRLSDGSLNGFAAGSPLKVRDVFLSSHDRCFTPQSLAIHPSGKFLYMDCPGDDLSTEIVGGPANGRLFGILAFTADPASGALALSQTEDCCETQAVLNGVIMHPAGSFLLALTEGISVFAINQSNGMLTEVAGSPFVATAAGSDAFPRSLAIENTGKFVYAIRGSDLALVSFSLDASNGALTQLSASTPSMGSGTSFTMQIAQP